MPPRTGDSPRLRWVKRRARGSAGSLSGPGTQGPHRSFARPQAYGHRWRGQAAGVVAVTDRPELPRAMCVQTWRAPARIFSAQSRRREEFLAWGGLGEWGRFPIATGRRTRLSWVRQRDGIISETSGHARLRGQRAGVGKAAGLVRIAASARPAPVVTVVTFVQVTAPAQAAALAPWFRGRAGRGLWSGRAHAQSGGRRHGPAAGQHHPALRNRDPVIPR